MTEIRRNEFKDLLEMNDLMFVESNDFIKVDIPELGACTYYPKKNRLNIHNGNKWESDAFYYVKNILGKDKPEVEVESKPEITLAADHEFVEKIQGIAMMDISFSHFSPYYSLFSQRQSTSKMLLQSFYSESQRQKLIEQLNYLEGSIKQHLFL